MSDFIELDIDTVYGMERAENKAGELGYPDEAIFAFEALGALEGWLSEHSKNPYAENLKKLDLILEDTKEKMEDAQSNLEEAKSNKEEAEDEDEIEELEDDIKRYEAQYNKALENYNKAEMYRGRNAKLSDEFDSKFKDSAGWFSEVKKEVWDKEYSGPEDALRLFHEIKDISENNGLFKNVFEEINNDYAKNASILASQTKDVTELSAAMGAFNTDRGKNAKESEEHRNLRESTEQFEQDLLAFKSGVYQSGDRKGELMSEAERKRLGQLLVQEAEKVTELADAYSSKKNPFTKAGKARKAGAESIKRSAQSIKASIEAELNMDELKAGIDKDLNEELREVNEEVLNQTEAPDISAEKLKRGITDKEYATHRAHEKYNEFNKKIGEKIAEGKEVKGSDIAVELSEAIAANTIARSVNKGKLKYENASIRAAAEKIRESGGMKMLLGDSNNPKTFNKNQLEQFANMSGNELFAKWATAEQSVKMQHANTRRHEARVNQPQMAGPKM